MLAPWKKNYDPPRQHIKKQRHYFANKDPSSQSYGFSSSHVWMWELDYKESWGPKNWCFQTLVLEKTLENLLDSKEIKPVNPKGNQSWIFFGRTDTEAEAPILWPPDVKNWLIWKDPDAGKDWSREENGPTEDKMVALYHRLNGHEFEQALVVADGQGSLVCCSPWGCKESDTTERLYWTGAHNLLAPFCHKLEHSTFCCVPSFCHSTYSGEPSITEHSEFLSMTTSYSTGCKVRRPGLWFLAVDLSVLTGVALRYGSSFLLYKVNWVMTEIASNFTILGSLLLPYTFCSSVQFSPVAQLCLTVFDPMDCSTPDFPVHHQLQELAQTHVHWVGDAIQPPHPLSSPSPPTFKLCQHQGLFQWVSSSHQVAKVL